MSQSNDRDVDTVSRAAEALWEATDSQDQDAAELAMYADGDEDRADWFNANTYLKPLEAAAGEVVLQSETDGETFHVPGTFFYFDEDTGQFTAQVSERLKPETGATAVARFAHAYAEEGLALRPKHIDETPLTEVEE